MVITGARCNASQASHHTLNGSNHRWLPKVEHIQNGPNQQARRRTHVRIQHRYRRHHVRRVRCSPVKTRPPHPQ